MKQNLQRVQLELKMVSRTIGGCEMYLQELLSKAGMLIMKNGTGKITQKPPLVLLCHLVLAASHTTPHIWYKAYFQGAMVVLQSAIYI